MEIQIDYIPIYIDRDYPTKEDYFHSKGKIPPGVKKGRFIEKMIEHALRSDYLINCDTVIILEEGKVIGVHNKKEEE